MLVFLRSRWLASKASFFFFFLFFFFEEQQCIFLARWLAVLIAVRPSSQRVVRWCAPYFPGFVFAEVVFFFFFFFARPKAFFWTPRSHGYGRTGEDRVVVASRQLYSFADERIMSSKDAQKCQVPHTADSDELAHARGCTAVSHKPRPGFPSAGSRTNLRALYGTPPRIILSQCFHHNLFIKLSQLWTWGEDMQPRGIAPNQQIISKALWNILFKSVTDCVLPDMRAEHRTVVDAVGLGFFAELGAIFVKMFKPPPPFLMLWCGVCLYATITLFHLNPQLRFWR